MRLYSFLNEITWDIFMSHGYANGYVAIPPEHPLYKKDYDEVEGVLVHGGLTFSNMFSNFKTDNIELLNGEIPEDYWVFGFDTCHFGDNSINWSREKCIEETERLERQLEKYETFSKN